MEIREQIAERLDSVLVPAVNRSLVAMHMVRDIAISDSRAKVTIAETGLDEEARELISAAASEIAGEVPGINGVAVTFAEAKPADLNSVKNVIAVMSGKGGVGKSLVSGLAAIALRRQGYTVGILDADITGPSIPHMFGLSERPAGSESGIFPVVSQSGIEIMSINLLLPSEDEAVIWRGPLIGGAIKQFWEEVIWGELDYLIVDLPPGTADAPLTVMQTLPISGVIIVFTPQDLTAMIVRKAVNMARKMEKPIVGVVENMAYLYVPEIDKNIEIFGRGQGEEMAQAAGAPFLGQLPIDPELARLCDEGHIEGYHTPAVDNLAASLHNAVVFK